MGKSNFGLNRCWYINSVPICVLIQIIAEKLAIKYKGEISLPGQIIGFIQSGISVKATQNRRHCVRNLKNGLREPEFPKHCLGN